MKETRISKRALQWTPQGRRKVGRPEVTWRSTITKELIEMGMITQDTRLPNNIEKAFNFTNKNL
ncbi:zinc transporter 8 [Brachionus plicatilis]|uniref:Zinc transporter 8 n=1 Tax=Brachionus plicatilis TaxID=10195 RepID=A0A3M7QX00_BRAPC|nr:zinc transporter 8 [Brachionus plicatilis]